MSQHAPLAGTSGAAHAEGDPPRAGARPRPDALEREVDALFVDADRHGPRWPALARRIVPALVLLVVTFLLGTLEGWRAPVLAALDGSLADAALVAPVLVALVVAAAAFAPLARTRTLPLVVIAVLALGASTALVRQGDVVYASLPGAIGALLLGVAGARAIRRAVWLLPLLLAAGVSDVHSVQRGVTRDLLDDASTGASAREHATALLTLDPSQLTRLDHLVLHLPAASSTWLVGMVDVAALGLLLALTHLYWLPLGRTAVALGAVLSGAVLLDVPVPLLPLLGIAWACVHARLVWRATRFELRRLTYLGG